MQPPQFNRDHVEQAVTGLHYYIEALRALVQAQRFEPLPGSIAAHEVDTFANPALCRTAYTCGGVAWESAADHLMGLPNLLKEPSKPWASWTSVRGLLEACAIASWLVDPNIGALERVSRQFAYRYEGISEQEKMAREAADQATLDKLDARIQHLEQQANKVGLDRVADKYGRLIGIGQRWPGITELTEITLGEKKTYRRLSAIAHCHAWALIQVGFSPSKAVTSSLADEIAAEKVAKPESILWITLVSIMSLSRVTDNVWRLYGLDQAALYAMLETAYDALGYNDKVRFWRP